MAKKKVASRRKTNQFRKRTSGGTAKKVTRTQHKRTKKTFNPPKKRKRR